MSWDTETNIKGPPGQTGAKGDTGATGATGPQGPQGATGPQGPAGASGSGAGDVVGPAGAVADRIAVYSGTTGKIIKDGGKLIADLAPVVSPVFTGDPQAPTPATADSDTSIATTAFVKAQGYAASASVPVPATATPLAGAGSGAVGVATKYAREDHVHPAGGGGSAVYASDTPPAGAPDNSLWVETDTGLFFFKYNDGTSSQWVVIPGGITDVVRYSAQTLTAAQRSQARANIDVTKKNYIINGAMMVSQENGTALVTANVSYPVDQFFMTFNNSGAQNAQQILTFTPGGSPNRLRVTATTPDASVAAGDFLAVETILEGFRTADLKFGGPVAKTITLQFGVRAPAGTYCVAFRNATSDRCYVTEYVISAGETNTDIVRSITIPGDVLPTWKYDFNAGLIIVWALMGGTTYQQAAGSWGTIPYALATSNQFNFMGTVNNVFELFDVSLTEGSVAPPFQLPDYASELAACQRYWTKGLAAYAGYITTGQDGATVQVYYPATMRIIPTMTINSAGQSGFNPAGSVINADAGGALIYHPAAVAGAASFYDAWIANARL